ncbi:unnamed protein product, partial [Ixodes pacificus]
MERQSRDLWEPITGDQWGLSLASSIVSPGRTASGTWGARFQQSLAAPRRSGGRFVTDCDCGPPHKGSSDASIGDPHFWKAPALGSKPDPWATLRTDWWNDYTVRSMSVTTVAEKTPARRLVVTAASAAQHFAASAAMAARARASPASPAPALAGGPPASSGGPSRGRSMNRERRSPRRRRRPSGGRSHGGIFMDPNMMRAPRCRRCPGNERRRTREHEPGHAPSPRGPPSAAPSPTPQSCPKAAVMGAKTRLLGRNRRTESGEIQARLELES